MIREMVTTQLPSGTWLRPSCGHDGQPQADQPFDCADCDLRLIPDVAVLGRRTPTFTTGNTPPALLKAHRTSAWAELVVQQGEVEFADVAPAWQTIATPERGVVIVPERTHHITPAPGAHFHIQFHDLPRTR